MTERTLVLVKPDGVQRQLTGPILARYEERGLKIVGLKLVQVDRDLAERHYAVHREKPFFSGLVDFITSAPLVALALEGPNAIAVVRAINGATRPHEAARARSAATSRWRPRRTSSTRRTAPEAAVRARAVVRRRGAARVRARRRPLGARSGGVTNGLAGRSGRGQGRARLADGAPTRGRGMAIGLGALGARSHPATRSAAPPTRSDSAGGHAPVRTIRRWPTTGGRPAAACGRRTHRRTRPTRGSPAAPPSPARPPTVIGPRRRRQRPDRSGRYGPRPGARGRAEASRLDPDRHSRP